MEKGIRFPAKIKSESKISILACLVMVGSGCSAPKLASDERASITHIVIHESHGGLATRFSPLLPENGIVGTLGSTLGGALSGAVEGAYVGTNPIFWIFGPMGPIGAVIVGTPLGAVFGAAAATNCSTAFSEIDQPAGKLKQIRDGADLAAFRKALDANLQDELKARAEKTEIVNAEGPVPSLQATTRTLEIHKLEIVVIGTTSPKDWKCSAGLEARASWRVAGTTNQVYPESNVSYCDMRSPLAFKEWFGDPEQRSRDVTGILRCLGHKVALHLLTGVALPGGAPDARFFASEPSPTESRVSSSERSPEGNSNCIKNDSLNCIDIANCAPDSDPGQVRQSKCD